VNRNLKTDQRSDKKGYSRTQNPAELFIEGRTLRGREFFRKRRFEEKVREKSKK